jgi:hypothetical protein
MERRRTQQEEEEEERKKLDSDDKHDDHELRSKALEVARAIKDLGASIGKTMDSYITKQAPRAVAFVDRSLTKASKGFESALSDIDKKTARQQFELLLSYRNFLQQQTELVNKKLNSLKNSQNATTTPRK